MADREEQGGGYRIKIKICWLVKNLKKNKYP